MPKKSRLTPGLPWIGRRCSATGLNNCLEMPACGHSSLELNMVTTWFLGASSIRRLRLAPFWRGPKLRQHRADGPGGGWWGVCSLRHVGSHKVC